MKLLAFVLLNLFFVNFSSQCSVKVNNFVAAFRLLNDVPIFIPEEALQNIDAPIVNIICPSGFNDPDLPHDNSTMATLFCDNGKWQSSEGIFNYTKDLVLNCRSRKLTFYKANISTCDATNIALGYEVNKKIIVHAESCFDLFEMKVKYLHFIARPLKSLISVENNVIQTENHETVEFPEVENFEKHDDLKDRFNKTFPEINFSQFYDYFPLVSEEMFPVVTKSVNLFPFSVVNRAILMKNLMMHNWKKFMTLLHERTLNGFEYDVYAGISGYTNVPLNLKHKMDFRPKRLIYYPQRIPKYIWAYLNTTSSSKEAETLIVVGVNSIFVTKGSFEDYSLCKDVCDKFKWLEPLSITRHMAAFGYMYCCHLTNNIRNLLEGLHNLHCPETMFIDPECGRHYCK